MSFNYMTKKMIILTGLGSSGTRVYAEIFKNFGFHIGNHLNESFDNLDTALGGMNIIPEEVQLIKNYDYNKFLPKFKIALENSGFNNNFIVFKNPNNMWIIELISRYCRDKKIELNVFYIFCPRIYMINRLHEVQYQHYWHLFKDKYKYEKNSDYNKLEWLYYSNEYFTNFLSNNKIRYFIHNYKNLVENTEQEINNLKKELLEIDDKININSDNDKDIINKIKSYGFTKNSYKGKISQEIEYML